MRLMDETEGASGSGLDPHLADMLSRILALGTLEADVTGESVGQRLGLGAADLKPLARFCPDLLRPVGAREKEQETYARDDEEEQVHALLLSECAEGSPILRLLAAIVARRAMEPNHLWQDLGLPSRADLRLLMEKAFPALAARNDANMRWKKFFYRELCEREGFVLCTAPSCGVCTDFSECFGDETGESRMADLRRQAERVEYGAILAG